MSDTPERSHAPEVEESTTMHVILEYPAAPDVTRAIQLAFAHAGIDARLRAAPRRREFESSVWRVVVNAPLHELVVALDGPRFSRATALKRLVEDISSAWSHGPDGHIEVGPRGKERRATGGVLLTPDLPETAYTRLVTLAASTLDADRLLLWDPQQEDWTAFDSVIPDIAPVGSSAAEGASDVAGEAMQRRFRRGR